MKNDEANEMIERYFDTTPIALYKMDNIGWIVDDFLMHLDEESTKNDLFYYLNRLSTKVDEILDNENENYIVQF